MIEVLNSRMVKQLPQGEFPQKVEVETATENDIHENGNPKQADENAIFATVSVTPRRGRSSCLHNFLLWYFLSSTNNVLLLLLFLLVVAAFVWCDLRESQVYERFCTNTRYFQEKLHKYSKFSPRGC